MHRKSRSAPILKFYFSSASKKDKKKWHKKRRRRYCFDFEEAGDVEEDAFASKKVRRMS